MQKQDLEFLAKTVKLTLEQAEASHKTGNCSYPEYMGQRGGALRIAQEIWWERIAFPVDGKARKWYPTEDDWMKACGFRQDL